MKIFKREPKHECDMMAVGCSFEAHKNGDVTHFMLKCECGEWYVETHSGNWEKESFQIGSLNRRPNRG